MAGKTTAKKSTATKQEPKQAVERRQRPATTPESSDYPQQPIAGGDFLQGERDSTRTQNNTGTVTNEQNKKTTQQGDKRPSPIILCASLS